MHVITIIIPIYYLIWASLESLLYEGLLLHRPLQQTWLDYCCICHPRFDRDGHFIASITLLANDTDEAGEWERNLSRCIAREQTAEVRSHETFNVKTSYC